MSSRLPAFLLSIGMEGKVLNASNSELKMLTTLKVDRRMACAYRVSVPRLHHGSEILVGSLYFQLVVLAISLRHPLEAVISPIDLFSAGRSHRHCRLIRIQSSGPPHLSWRYTNWAPAGAPSHTHEAKSHMKCKKGQTGGS